MRITVNTIQLIPTESVKRETNILCKECEQIILIGEKYIHVKANDTFVNRPYGGFHPECWDNFKLKHFKK